MKRIEEQRQRRRAARLSGLAALALLVILTQPRDIVGQQWTTNGDNINNTNPGNVGVGTTSPTEKLEVSGTLKATGHVAIGADSAVNKSPYNSTIPTRSLLDARETITDLTTNTQYNGLFPTWILNPGANAYGSSAVRGLSAGVMTATGNPYNFYNLYGGMEYVIHNGTGVLNGTSGSQVTVQNTSSGTITSAKGSQGIVLNTSSGLITSAAGVDGWAGNTAGGNITTAIGGKFYVTNGTGVITTGYGVQILRATNGTGGTFTNNYGLHIADQSAVGSANSFNLFSDGANSKNFFAGKVGIGTTSPARLLDIQGGYGGLRVTGTNSAVGSVLELKNTTASPTLLGAVNFVNAADVAPGQIAYLAGHALIFSTNGAEKVRIDGSGNVGIGTTTPAAKLHVAGDINVDGNINAKYQDVAEWVPSRQKLAAGTVVVLDPEQSNNVMASASAYDTRVAGVVSAQPGVLLGEGGEGKLMVATTGRVRVKVDATRAPIKVGDLLVTGDTEGAAMKSVPLDLGGTPIHRPGTIIGKALEPLEKGTGEILVLLSLQ